MSYIPLWCRTLCAQQGASKSESQAKAISGAIEKGQCKARSITRTTRKQMFNIVAEGCISCSGYKFLISILPSAEEIYFCWLTFCPFWFLRPTCFASVIVKIIWWIYSLRDRTVATKYLCCYLSLAACEIFVYISHWLSSVWCYCGMWWWVRIMWHGMDQRNNNRYHKMRIVTDIWAMSFIFCSWDVARRAMTYTSAVG